MSSTKIITAIEAVNMLENFNGTSGTFATVYTKTDPSFKSKKILPDVSKSTGCNPSDIKKLSSWQIKVNTDYESTIQSRKDNLEKKEGITTENYERGESWHIPFNGSKMIHQHKTNGTLYFFFIAAKNGNNETRYIDESTGKDIPEIQIKEYLKDSGKADNQHLPDDEQVIVRCLKLDSLKAISLCGEKYIIS